MTENKFLRALQSRKLWAAIIGFISILWVSYQSGNTLDPDTVINAILGIVAAYIAATAWEDGKQAEAVGKMVEAENQQATTTITTPGTSNVEVTNSDSKPRIGTMGME